MLFPNRQLKNRFQARNRRRESAFSYFAKAWTQVRSRGILTLILAACSFLVQPALSATAPAPYTAFLAWDRSPESSVTGYRVYYGTSPRNYTNSVVAGNAMNATISGLKSGITYYFAVTAYDASGAQSDFSNEVKVVPGQPRVRLEFTDSEQAVLTVSGLVGHTYDILASTNLTSWAVIGNTTLGATASQDFTDTNAVSFPKRFYRTRDTTPNAVVTPAEATVQILATGLQQAVLSVTGVPGQIYDVQTTTDLTNWITLGRVFLDATGTQIFADRTWRPYNNRSYRAVAVTP